MIYKKCYYVFNRNSFVKFMSSKDVLSTILMAKKCKNSNVTGAEGSRQNAFEGARHLATAR